MRFGCATSDVNAVYMLKELGYDYIELSGKMIASMDKKAFEQVQNILHDSGLACECFTAYCPSEIVIAGEGADVKAAIRYAQRLAERAAVLGVRNVSVGSPFSRVLPDGYDNSLANLQACRFFEATAKVFGPYGITVCIEALGRCYCNFINTLEQASYIVQSVGAGNLGLVVDFYNMEHEGEADMNLKPYIENIFHAHISDDDNDPFRRDFLRTEKAEIHKRRIAAFDAAGYTARLSVEVDVPVTQEKAKDTLEILQHVYF